MTCTGLSKLGEVGRQRDIAQVRALLEGALSNLGRLGGNVISRKDVQLEKACSPISVRLGGSVISLNDVHPEKAHPPISVRLGGSVISRKDAHLKKAPSPI